MKTIMWKLKWTIVIKIATATLSILGAAMIPYLTKLFIDGDFSSNGNLMYRLPIYYLIAVAAYLFFERISQRNAWKLDQQYSVLLKGEYFTRMCRMPKNEMDQQKQTEIISALQNDIPFIGEKYIEGVVAVIQTSMQIAVYGMFLFYLDPRVLLVILAMAGISLFLPQLTSRRLSSLKGKHLSQMANFLQKAQDHVLGYRHVNAKTRGPILKNYGETLNNTEQAKLRFGKYKTFTNIIQGLFAEGIKYTVFVLVLILLLNQQISKGDAVASILYSGEFLFPLRYLVSCINDIKSTRDARNRVFDPMEKPHINDQFESTETIESIQLKDVGIRYGNFRLEGINFILEKGKKYLLMGSSGAGKSTIASLLCREKKPQSGDVLYLDATKQSIQNEIDLGYAAQDDHMYRDTFFNNITVFGAYPDRTAELPESIQGLTNRVRTTENCATLSGGEQQIVSLLRLFNQNASFVVFDEVLSAMDKETKSLFRTFLMTHFDTLLLITHDVDLEFLARFDKIMILKDGDLSIIETNTMDDHRLATLYNDVRKGGE